jgi:hypothetical protein
MSSIETCKEGSAVQLIKKSSHPYHGFGTHFPSVQGYQKRGAASRDILALKRQIMEQVMQE